MAAAGGRGDGDAEVVPQQGLGDRPRDEQGRPESDRPRDRLGRPLRAGEQGVPRVPSDLSVTPHEGLDLAQAYLDEGMPFHAHEVLEAVWKAASEGERDLWKGLAQLAVGVTHLLRGNDPGARRLLGRGARRIAPWAGRSPYGLDVDGLRATVGLLLADRGQMPEPDLRLRRPPHLRPAA